MLLALTDLQREAWQVAEEQGLHTPLDTMPLREATLVRLALLHTAVLDLFQRSTRAAQADALAAMALHIGDLAQTIGMVLPGNLGTGHACAIAADRHRRRLHELLAGATERVTCQGITGPVRAILVGLLSTVLMHVECLAGSWHLDLVATIADKLAVNRHPGP